MMHIARLGVLMLTAAMLLVGCTQVKQVTGTEDCDDPSLISAQRQLCHQNATFNQTVAGGAAIGALGGAAIGALTCGIAGKNPLVCAAIGGAAGLFAGGVTGYVVAKKQEAAHDNVRAIDGVTADLRKQNEDLQSDVIAARQVAAHGQQKLASIKAAVRSGTISADQARAERAKIGQDSERLANIISHLQEQEQNFQEASHQVGQSSPDYTRQLAEMKRNVRVLEQQKDALDRAMAAG